MKSLNESLKISFDEKLYEECDKPQKESPNLIMYPPKGDSRKLPVLRDVDFSWEGQD